MNEEEGWKISKFIKNARLLDYDDKEDIEKAVSLMTRLHQSGKSTPYAIEFEKGLVDFKEKLIKRNRFEFDDKEELEAMVGKVVGYLNKIR